MALSLDGTDRRLVSVGERGGAVIDGEDAVQYRVRISMISTSPVAKTGSGFIVQVNHFSCPWMSVTVGIMFRSTGRSVGDDDTREIG